jgi:RNA polymerase sigma factor (sigma-70 family)
MRTADAVERQRGWDAWYRRDAPVIQTYIERRCHVLGLPGHSEDLLQDCFLIGFKNVSNRLYREEKTALRPYLIGIVKNLLHEVIRLQRREPILPTGVEIEDSTAFGLDDTILMEEIMQWVREARECQSDLYQQVVEGIYGDGKSAAELAGELDKTAGNIRAIAHRAVHDIRQHLVCQHKTHLSSRAIRACLEAL